jgi:phospho-N-acetylmuramoyl-pentapeptide-transferase
VISLLLAAGIGFFFTLLLTPVAIRALRKRSIGQFIQEDVSGHMHKRGTPTMGGVVIIAGVVLGFVAAHFRLFSFGNGPELTINTFHLSGLLAIFALVGMGVIGFFDDYIKYARKHNQGLTKGWKFGGQLVVAGLFAWGAEAAGVSTELSFVRGVGIDLGPVLYFLLVLFMLTATANGVNLTDGLDGLVAGSTALVFGAYVLIGFWQFRNFDVYQVEGALDLAVVGAALAGTVLGFLWWNAAPAKIFMGDTGSQALGGALAALALLTNTQLLLIILGGLYVLETASVIAQVIAFRGFGRRVLKMAPIHHHFELRGWPETTVIVRFWILAGIAVALGIGLFYADFVSITGGVTP